MKPYPGRFGKLLLLIILLCLIWVLAKKHSHGRPLAHLPHPRNQWTIGVFRGKSPLDLKPCGAHEPVLTPRDVTDIKARYLADPFLMKVGSRWYLFFEAMNAKSRRGEIAYAFSRDALHWSYGKDVIAEPFHLSFPYVFEQDGQYYIMPESRQAHEIRLYKATQFPTKWRLETVLVKGDYVDPSIIKYHGKWWIMAAAVPRKKALHLFYSDNLCGPYTEHPKSPIVFGSKHNTRPGGRMIVFDGKLLRFAQDDETSYGLNIRAFEITQMTEKAYAEKELPCSPVLKGSGSGWNAGRMHTLDAHQMPDGSWIASVDGAPW